MGILNLTPDSFYDGGSYIDNDTALKQTEHMLAAGATFIDMGAYSSRPGATHIAAEEELKRLLPMVDLIGREFPEIIISIDTFRAEVAALCLDHGAAMINDISAGGLDPEMMPTIAKYQVPIVMMHMKGTPQNMQEQTNYDDLLIDMLTYFSEKIALARQLKINDLIVDPGFGFSKNVTQNFEVLKHLELFKTLNLPVLVGVSRKSMIYKTLKTDAAHALNGTTALHMHALQKGAHILRVHDVKEAMECIAIHESLL
jgi:dihydropteroate synthase